MSVLLFSAVPFEGLRSPRTLRITGESATSVRLLYLLLGQLHGYERLPLLAGRRLQPDAELLIGDRALVRGWGTGVDKGLYVTDLSRRWFDWQGLPFVFARWVVRKEAPRAVKAAVARWLKTFKKNEAVLAEQAVLPAAEALQLGQAVIRRYFRVIRRCLDGRDLAGQERFVHLFKQVGSTPLFRSAA